MAKYISKMAAEDRQWVDSLIRTIERQIDYIFAYNNLNRGSMKSVLMLPNGIQCPSLRMPS